MNFIRSLVIAAPTDALFTVTQDYGRRLEWDPFLRSATLVSGADAAGLGVRARCTARNGLVMETEYVSFNPPRTCAVKMTEGPWLLSTFAGSWRFEETTPGCTQVTFRYSLKARPAFLSWLLTPILGRWFGRESRQRLAALKRFVEAARPLAASPRG